MRPATKPRILALMLALLLVLLLAACGQAAAKPQATATAPTPTPFPTQAPVPTVAVIPSGGVPIWGNVAAWSHANLPAGFGMQFKVSDLQVAESDGKTAYACAAPDPQSKTTRVIVTHDGGATWAYVANIPATWDGCGALAIDLLDPSVVIATASYDITQEITYDGGQSWQALSQTPQQGIYGFATRGDVAYALMNKPNVGPNGASAILAESDDHLRTWHEIDSNLAPMNLRNFWINPGNGALLLQTYASGLYTSSDDGAHWAQMYIPESGIVDYMVQQPIANQPWRLCAEYYGSQNDSTGTLVCTTDGGNAWFTPPVGTFWQMAGIASDGAMLVYDSGFMVYRLPVGATRWQKLGAAPHTGCCIHYHRPTRVVCCGCSRRRAMAQARHQTHGQSLAPCIPISEHKHGWLRAT